MRTFFTLLALAFAPFAAAAEPPEIRNLAEGAASPPAKIEQLEWLVGHWKGEGLGGQSEEFVAPPLNGQMMGMFRQTKEDGALFFYEFYTYAEKEGTLVLKIKHFTPDLTGWEEKGEFVEFPLVAVENEAVYFDGLTFKMTGENELQASVDVEGQGVVSFRYDRQ